MSTCLFCRSKNTSPAAFPRPTKFNGKVFGYQQCNDCKLVYIDPIPTTDDYNKMYSKEYHNEFYFAATPDYSNWLALFDKHAPVKSIVDYGCGDAGLVKWFHNKGFKCTGIEYNPELVAKLREQNPGITFYSVDEFWSNPDIMADMFFMGDVLEHIADPLDFLEKLYTRLKPGGLMALQGPLEGNASLGHWSRKVVSGVKTMMTKEPASHVPYHITFSNVDNQRAVMKRVGLQELYFNVSETPWPYPETFSLSPFYFIGQLSIGLSKVFSSKLGNRFMYLGKKPA